MRIIFNHPELLALATEMGYTDAQLDALFGIEVTG